MEGRIAMKLCPECAPGPQHNELACRECLNNLKNVLTPVIRRPPPELKYVDEKRMYVLNVIVAELVSEAIMRGHISESSTALLSMKEIFKDAMIEQREYGQQLADEASAQLERMGVK
jgi:hypothetical protein